MLAVGGFAIYVLWTWWSGTHRGADYNPSHPWVGRDAAVGLLLGTASIWCRAARRPVFAGLFAAALLALVIASFAGLQFTRMRPSVALNFGLLALGLLSLNVRQLKGAAVPSAFGVASFVVAANVAGYFIIWQLQPERGLYLMLASPLTAALQAVLAAALVMVALRTSDLQALRRNRALMGAAALVLVTLVSGWAYLFHTSGEHASGEAEARVVNAVQVLTEHAHRTMDPADLILQTIVQRVREIGLSSYMLSSDEWDRARSAVKRLKQLSSVIVLDASGRVVMFTEQFPAAVKGTFDHRDYFLAHKRGEDFFLGQLIVAGSGKKIFSLSRQLKDADGKFLGVVVAAMELEYFEQFYDSVDGGRDTAIALIRNDGKPLVRVPIVPDLEKADLASDELFTRHLRERRSGTFLNTSPFDGRQRLAAFRESAELPMVIVATAGSEPIAAGVEREFLASALLLSMALVLLSAALGNQVKAREREMRDKLALARNQAFTRSVLDSMSASVAIISATGTIIDVNNQWSAFARVNGASDGGSFVGGNYLEVCEEASGTNEDASAALQGIQAVIDGERSAFQMSYPCHSPEEQRWFRMHVTQLGAAGAGAVISHVDITELKLAEQRLEQQAMVDPLTGLANRRDFDTRIEEAMARSRRSKRPMALIFLDVDYFKAINDTRGHHVGDQVLKELARRLTRSIRVTDRAFRLAGTNSSYCWRAWAPQMRRLLSQARFLRQFICR